jgi:hypothetical protein
MGNLSGKEGVRSQESGEKKTEEEKTEEDTASGGDTGKEQRRTETIESAWSVSYQMWNKARRKRRIPHTGVAREESAFHTF